VSGIRGVPGARGVGGREFANGGVACARGCDGVIGVLGMCSGSGGVAGLCSSCNVVLVGVRDRILLLLVGAVMPKSARLPNCWYVGEYMLTVW
jgi:hypothetical protein